jgi:hypothetical protein
MAPGFNSEPDAAKPVHPVTSDAAHNDSGSGTGRDGATGRYRPTSPTFLRQNNNYLTTGQLNGAGNISQQKGTFSVWLRFLANDGHEQEIVEVTNVGRNQMVFVAGITRAANNTISFDLTDCLDNPVLNMSTNGAYTSENGWIHVLAAWDVGAGSASIFVNGQEDTKVNALNNGAICYPALEWGVGGLNSGQLDADVADLYADLGRYQNIGDPAVREKFIQDGMPVDLGPNCTHPTGGAPIACFNGPIGSWNVNLGTGGGMSLGNNSSPLAAATTNPAN